MDIKQHITIHTVANTAEIVAGDELVYHASQGLKIGRAAPDSFLDYASLPPLFDKVNEANGVKLVENIKTLGGLVASQVFTYDGNKTTNYQQAIDNGLWYEFNQPFSTTKWSYRKKVQLPFNYLLSQKLIYKPPISAAAVELQDYTTTGEYTGQALIGGVYYIDLAIKEGKRILEAIPAELYSIQFFGFGSLE